MVVTMLAKLSFQIPEVHRSKPIISKMNIFTVTVSKTKKKPGNGLVFKNVFQNFTWSKSCSSVKISVAAGELNCGRQLHCHWSDDWSRFSTILRIHNLSSMPLSVKWASSSFCFFFFFPPPCIQNCESLFACERETEIYIERESVCVSE